MDRNKSNASGIKPIMKELNRQYLSLSSRKGPKKCTATQFNSPFSDTHCLKDKTTLREHAYSNILKILSPKNESFQMEKNANIFHISAENIDCGYSLEPPRRGGSNEYPHSMFLSSNKTNNVYPCKPQFYYIKVGFKGGKVI